ncbi:Activin receptor type-2A [Trichinella spiralis]|uniref:Uncharacterized protein n=3 Tax=Trichinella spiralis TaxID=6334 RepID=A0A0V1AQ85_TRISP|nr:hypothetical protein T01_4206 [Trichinella spiralis]KRY26635.1 hypothetical protein T01_2836 [Trichinella spiralis]KRY26713.1 hypothetical protein T01_5745 [Trichinella spiralis]
MPTETVCTRKRTAAQLRFCTCRSVGQLCFRLEYTRPAEQPVASEQVLNTTKPSIHCTLETSARSAQPLEPILVPKLRIRFADFPYLHYSIGQRLFTLETCCGYQYDQVRDLPGVARIFTYRRERSEHREKVGVLWIPESLSPDNPVPGNASLKKKRKLFSKLTTVIFRVRLRYRAIELNANPTERLKRYSLSPLLGSGISTGFPFENIRQLHTTTTGDDTIASTTTHTQIIIQSYNSCRKFEQAFAVFLGSTDPCPTAVHMEPCSTSAFKVLT